ncbi:MAG TPA: hypothetical protein PLV33_08190 [Opitutaceae bacterium]|jgi:hypothetical protein|nr:hypothetical protein [Opitutaceae bacterium]HOF09960.1 hypothetical protein [Opitutaceae bacterium]HOR25319.1 hypothetical protein [Opitutaceae bacterium]HPK49696.1 hypothetical protein [Opitutaceae bacterium]HQL22345.1 hypothetical protein [Opitutaceae bacterium]
MENEIRIINVGRSEKIDGGFRYEIRVPGFAINFVHAYSYSDAFDYVQARYFNRASFTA